MNTRALSGLALALALLGLFAYGLMAHRFSVVDDRSPASYLFAIISIFGLLTLTALLNRAWFSALALVVAAGAFGWWFWYRAELSTTWIYLAQHAGTHAALGVLFGASLAPGRIPLVTRMARLLHGDDNPRRDRYTRQVTIAWTLYFGFIALSSLGLYLTGHRLAWSWLANVLTIPLLVSMFILEYLVRRVRLPHEATGRLADGWLAYQRLRDTPKPRDPQ